MASKWFLQPVEPKGGPKLAIQLNITNHLAKRSPGDTVAGHVQRQAHAVSPHASVVIKLMGRSVAMLRKKTGTSDNETTRHYKSEFNLLNLQPVILFDGPLHIPPDTQQPHSWPFTFNIPSVCSPSIAGGQNPNESFIPFSGGGPAPPLPFTFHTRQGTPSSFMTAWIEFYLEANLVEQHGNAFKTTATAVHLITIHPPTIPPLLELTMHRLLSIEPSIIRSQRLLPGMEDADLSFKQKTLKFFHSTSVPRYVFKVCVDLPDAIQLGAVVPFRIKILPLPHHSDHALEKTGQEIRLQSATVKMKALTGIAVPQGFGVRADWDLNKEMNATEVTVSPKVNGGQFIVVPSSSSSSGELGTDDGVLPLDVGTLVDLRFDMAWVDCAGQRIPIQKSDWMSTSDWLYPSFVTYNIRRGYRMKLVLALELAKETVKVDFYKDIVIAGGWK
ncbi:hypothetical protein B0H63DRAFT_483780 [Podospora didyma]|uniref:Arrestin-like N-terminal domain-containing protein n=1 Tax=Podospora didyma TaxID=330526 RepID=A0AAE0K8G1_9PEZI|nr:hypothetical protein B0H63DRAFT_483780 [Podospora didyma]